MPDNHYASIYDIPPNVSSMSITERALKAEGISPEVGKTIRFYGRTITFLDLVIVPDVWTYKHRLWLVVLLVGLARRRGTRLPKYIGVHIKQVKPRQHDCDP